MVDGGARCFASIELQSNRVVRHPFFRFSQTSIFRMFSHFIRIYANPSTVIRTNRYYYNQVARHFIILL